MFCITLMNHGILIYLNRNQNILNTAKSDLNLFPEKGGGGMPPPFVLPVIYTCRFWRDDAMRNANRPIFCISGHTNHVAHNNQRNAPDLPPELFP